jgi:Spy/CpxP family protein refolding chaperone
MSFLLRQLGFVAVAAVACFYVFVALKGPNGIPTMVEKRHQLERMRQENETLRIEIQKRKTSIEQLENSDEARKRAVRESTRNSMRGYVTIYLSDPPSAGDSPR